MTKTEKTILNGGGITSEGITLHSINRFKSRIGISDPKEIKKLVDDAIEYGERNVDKKRNAIFITYNDYVLLFGRNSRKLITIYKSEENYGK